MHKKLISSVLLGSILMTPIYAYANPNRKDISGHWAKKEINQFISSGYVNGYEDGTFRPDNSITRAEFVKLVNKYFGFNNKEVDTSNVECVVITSRFEATSMGTIVPSLVEYCSFFQFKDCRGGEPTCR